MCSNNANAWTTGFISLLIAVVLSLTIFWCKGCHVEVTEMELQRQQALIEKNIVPQSDDLY